MENYGLRKRIFYCGKKEFEVINTCFQFFGFIRHLIVVYHLQMRVFVFVISYGCYGWQQESHHFFQRYVFYEKKNTKKKNMDTSKLSKASYFKRIIANSKVYYVFLASFAVVFKPMV